MKKTIATLLLLSSMLLTLTAQTGTWSGEITVQGTKLPLVFHLDEEHPAVDSPAQGAKGIPIQVERTATGLLNIKIPAINATYEGMPLARQIVGTLRQNGVSLSLTLVPGESRLNRPQTPQPPFPYGQEEVTFRNGDAVLKSTLVLPEGYSRRTPVLIMVTGSGLQNRDEEIFEHKPFAVIADALARAGIATLRYDDRGFGESVGDAVNCTTEDLKNDARSGIRLLRERFDRIGVLGHSEGGTIALMLASEGEADFIVSLAGMVVSGKETLLAQNRTAFTAAGYPATVVDTYCKLLGEAFDARLAGTVVDSAAPFAGELPSADGLDLPDALKQNYQGVLVQIASEYVRYFLALDMRPKLSAVACPVLALNGDRDIQVDHADNLNALRDGLPKNSANRIETVAGVNHLFQHCTTGSLAEYSTIEETFAPEVLETIVRWVLSLRE